MMRVTVYTLENCPRCEILKNFLKKIGIEFAEEDMSSPGALTELRYNGVFTLTAPVMQINNDFFYDEALFPEGKLYEEAIIQIRATYAWKSAR